MFECRIGECIHVMFPKYGHRESTSGAATNLLLLDLPEGFEVNDWEET